MIDSGTFLKDKHCSLEEEPLACVNLNCDANFLT